MKKSTKLLIKDSFFATLFSFLLIFLLSFIVINISFFNPLKKAVKDFSFLDVYYAENFKKSKGINKDIILINIEHKDRFELNQLIELVKESQPKVIGLDMIFKEPKISFSDSVLANTIKDSRVVNSYIIKDNEIIKNHSIFENENSEGFVNFNFDNKTSVIRNFKGIIKKKNNLHFSFPTLIAKKYLGEKFNQYNYQNKLKNTRHINFFGNIDTFMNMTFDDLMFLEDKSILNNKIVLLGYMGSPTGNVYDIEDKHFTPLNKISAGKSNPDMFGVVVHANIINMLINNDFIFRVSNFWIGIITFLCSFLGVLFFIWLGEKKLISFLFIKKFGLFLFTVIFMWLTFWFFKMGILFRSAPIIGVTLLSCSFITYYKYVLKKIQKKFKWNSYIK